ncbi:MAG: cytochrome b/b6 domain-containing protein [Eggerthellaceae bacterium]|jgi:formate dehydrogenase subunit gamma|nr:cytochrome b/b6 domain-containing protein [Eggerthellaceae bacterium]MDR2715565.1 cytochrome b/b6 domain-containing protein [Coriobacteriaceae bacterium]
MTRYIKRHTLQTRITHGTLAVSCILLAISGLFVFVPPLTALVPPQVTLAMRMAHRVLGIVFILTPLISGLLAPKGAVHFFKNYFEKWDKDDIVWMKRFIPYMLAPKKIHMPDQHEIKSGQRIADGAMILGVVAMAISGALLLAGATFAELGAGLMMAVRLVHDIAFLWLIVFGIAHIYLGAGIFQPYRGTVRLMFGDGKISESDALYHWGHWAREEIDKAENVFDDGKGAVK